MSDQGWIGKSVKRVEDYWLLTGRGTYIDDHPPVANLRHAAIVRLPHAHARILGYDLSAALAMDRVVGAITGADVLKHSKPFSVGVTAPVQYFCAATGGSCTAIRTGHSATPTSSSRSASGSRSTVR